LCLSVLAGVRVWGPCVRRPSRRSGSPPEEKKRRGMRGATPHEFVVASFFFAWPRRFLGGVTDTRRFASVCDASSEKKAPEEVRAGQSAAGAT
jgi:hypothetical protein